MATLTWTAPETTPSIGGKTFKNGTIIQQDGETLVSFGTVKMGGKTGTLKVRISDKPELAAAVKAVLAEQAEAKAILEATPEWKLQQKINQRRDLAEDVSILRQEASDRFNDMMDDELNDGVRMPKSLQKEITSAVELLSKFDAENPEVLVELERRNQAAIDRNMWN